MMRPTPPIEGRGSTLTVREDETEHEAESREDAQRRRQEEEITFHLFVIRSSVLLWFWARRQRLSTHCCHGNGRDLVDDVHGLHDGGGADGGRHDGWRCHGVGDGLHGALHGDQHGLAAEGGA